MVEVKINWTLCTGEECKAKTNFVARIRINSMKPVWASPGMNAVWHSPGQNLETSPTRRRKPSLAND